MSTPQTILCLDCLEKIVGQQGCKDSTPTQSLIRTKEGLQEKGALWGLTGKSFYNNVLLWIRKQNFSTVLRLSFFSLRIRTLREIYLKILPSSKDFINSEKPSEKHPELAHLHQFQATLSLNYNWGLGSSSATHQGNAGELDVANSEMNTITDLIWIWWIEL